MSTKPTLDQTTSNALVQKISLQVGCPLPCMGHDETKRTYREILDVVAQELEGRAGDRGEVWADATRNGILIAAQILRGRHA